MSSPDEVLRLGDSSHPPARELTGEASEKPSDPADEAAEPAAEPDRRADAPRV